MTVRRLQDDGDIATSGTQFLYKMEDTMQTLRTRLRLFYGEYFRDTSEGTQWFEQIFLKGTPDQGKDAEIRRRIQNYGQVSAIVDYSSNFDAASRTFNIKMTVLTSDGEGEMTVEESIHG